MNISAQASTPISSFPYAQPGLPTLLTALSFLFVLNAARVLADVTLHAGLVSEFFLGMIYGVPLAGILPTEWAVTFNVLGYLGLVCIIFEGGLSTNLSFLLPNLFLSCLCALTGIAMPTALSFALLSAGYGYSPLEAFAAGAALSSTSLGTTLAALNSVDKHAASASANMDKTEVTPSDIIELPGSSEDTPRTHERTSTSRSLSLHSPTGSGFISLQQTRIGTVLTSAAIIDDIVGLVVAALIPALAQTATSSKGLSNLAWELIRPLLASLLIALLTPPVTRYILRPLFWFHEVGERWCAPRREGKRWGWTRYAHETGWGIEPHADFVKTSIMVCVLSAFITIAYYTGSSVLFGAYMAGLTLTYIAQPPDAVATDGSSTNNPKERATALSFELAYTRLIGPVQEFVLAPIFFASVGYAIPFLSLWRPEILWRGVLYAILMCIGKLTVGLPVILWTVFPRCTHRMKQPEPARHTMSTLLSEVSDSRSPCTYRGRLQASMFPAAFIGIAMVSRGEIGLLIAQVARNGTSTGGTSAGGLLSDEGFLVCIWAILLCTLIGPICVGMIVRRWRGRVTAGIWA